MPDTILLKRLRRYLDARWAMGAFDPQGSLAGLSAAGVAEHVAANWGLVYAEDLLPHVAAWMERNL